MNELNYIQTILLNLETNELKIGLKACQAEGFSIVGFAKEPWKAPLPLLVQSLGRVRKVKGEKKLFYKAFLNAILELKKDSEDERSYIITVVIKYILQEDYKYLNTIEYLLCYFFQNDATNHEENNDEENKLGTENQEELKDCIECFNKLKSKYDKAVEQNESNLNTIDKLRELLKLAKKDKKELEKTLNEKINEKQEKIDELVADVNEMKNYSNKISDRNLYLTNENRKLEDRIKTLEANNQMLKEMMLNTSKVELSIEPSLPNELNYVEGENNNNFENSLANKKEFSPNVIESKNINTQIKNDSDLNGDNKIHNIIAIGCDSIALQYPADLNIVFESKHILSYEEYVENYEEIWVLKTLLPLKYKQVFGKYANENNKFRIFDEVSDVFKHKQEYVKLIKGWIENE